LWKIQKLANDKRTVLCISGRIEAEELTELQHAVSFEETSLGSVELDLENVRLVNQEVIAYFANCEASGTPLRNCPTYIREWIEREKGKRERRPEL
jgi:hypothetical protein